MANLKNELDLTLDKLKKLTYGKSSGYSLEDILVIFLVYFALKIIFKRRSNG